MLLLDGEKMELVVFSIGFLENSGLRRMLRLDGETTEVEYGFPICFLHRIKQPFSFFSAHVILELYERFVVKS